MSLEIFELMDEFDKLKDQIEKGDIDLINVDLTKYFKRLKGLITPITLHQATLFLEKGSNLVDQKINRIIEFLANLSKINSIKQFLSKNYSDEEYYKYLKLFWSQPTYIPSLSPEYLIQSFSRLKKKKERRTLTNIPQFDTKKNLQMQAEEIIDEEQDFEKEMEIYYDIIKQNLPLKLDEILISDKDPEKYFEHFAYILHLLQMGYLYFEESTGLFYVRNKYFENRDENEKNDLNDKKIDQN